MKRKKRSHMYIASCEEGVREKGIGMMGHGHWPDSHETRAQPGYKANLHSRSPVNEKINLNSSEEALRRIIRPPPKSW